MAVAIITGVVLGYVSREARIVHIGDLTVEKNRKKSFVFNTNSRCVHSQFMSDLMFMKKKVKKKVRRLYWLASRDPRNKTKLY